MFPNQDVHPPSLCGNQVPLTLLNDNRRSSNLYIFLNTSTCFDSSDVLRRIYSRFGYLPIEFEVQAPSRVTSTLHLKTKSPIAAAFRSSGLDQQRKVTGLSGDVLCSVTSSLTTSEADAIVEAFDMIILSGMAEFWVGRSSVGSILRVDLGSESCKAR
jgi:hypothetical protein